MRRTFATLAACLAVTGGVLVLPVYAAPTPAARPVEVSINEVDLGSVTAPEDDAVVTTDGDPVAGGVTEEEAAAVPSTEPAQESSAPTEESTGTEAPATAEPPAEGADDGVASSGQELAGVPALTVSQPDTEKFSTVGVTWRQDELTDVVVQVRVKDAAGAWGEWTTLEADDVEQTVTAKTEDHQIRGGTAPYWTGEAYGVEVIVQGAGGEAPRDVEVALVDPGTSTADTLPEPEDVLDQANAATGMPPVYTRASWGADEGIRTWDPEYAPTLKAATLHHTADRNTYTAAEVPGMMRSIYAYHSINRGWGDIGYNVVVDKFGRIFEGRYGGLTSTVVGAHAGGFNTGTFGVSMLGNYAEVDTPGAVIDAVAAITAWKLGIYGVDPNGVTQLTSGGGGTSRYAAGQVVTLPTIFAHRDVGNTTCPGQYAYNRMGQIRSAVSARYVAPAGSPVGNLDTFSISGDTLNVAGWTFDPDDPGATVPLNLLIDGVPAVEWQANGSRPDVGAVYPAAGPNHGFTASYRLPTGYHSICVVALTIGGSGSHNWMLCRTQRITAPPPTPTGNPFGNVDGGVRADGRTLTTSGWTLDPDTPSSALDVHVYVNGQWGGAVVANQSRPDVGAVYPAAGPNHGFSWSLPASAPGDHQVCVYAINKNAGTHNPQIGCGTVTVSAALWQPIGQLDSIALTNGRTATLSGWALDVDTPTSPVSVQVSVNGSVAKTVPADQSRPDVGAYFPGVGNAHGYSTSVDLPPGYHWVCATALNVGHGVNTPLGCRGMSVTAAAWNPIGNLDAVQRSGGVVTVAGWALDPDTLTRPVQIHLYVDGRITGIVEADGSRPDVGAYFPGAGNAHGYTASLPLPPGQQTICAYAINVGYGTHNPLLTCRTLPG